MSDLLALTEAVKSGDRASAVSIATKQVAAGAEPEAILAAMVDAMDQIGERYKKHEIFVPEMLIAARAMKEAMEVLEPRLVESGHEPIATAVIGTVQGDLHDIGKNLVAMMWKGASFKVIDLGTNVSAEKFVEAVRMHDAQIIGLSTLLTTTMPSMQRAVKEIREQLADRVKIVVGGAPITAEFARQIGADSYAPDAASAVDAIRAVLAA